MPLTTVEVQAHAVDPALAAALTAGDDVATAARLSELLTETVPVPITQLAALDLLRGSMSETFDTVAYGPMLDALQSAGMFSPAERDKLTMLATQPRTITPSDVARAVRNDDGSSKL